MTLPTESVTEAGSGLVFVNSYDGSVSSAYRGAIVAAENQLQSDFTNTATINVSFSLAPLSASDAAQNQYTAINVGYAQLAHALQSHAISADAQLAANGLPAIDPSHGAGFQIPLAYAEMLGLTAQTSQSDLTVTLNSTLGWTFGQDAVGVIEHEITEGGFGRVASLGFAAPQWAPLDLFRFTAAGQRDYTGGEDGLPAYFGLDSSHVSALAYHSGVSPGGVFDGQDLGDWDTAADVFGPGGPGADAVLSPTDIQVLNALGWNTAASNSAAADVGTAGNDVLQGAAGGDMINGLAGDDTITGSTGHNVLSGGDGNDLITGGTGFNQINGNKGDDTIVGNSQTGDWLLGGQGNDSIVAHSSAHNLIYGNIGNDTLVAGSGGDTLRGGQGDDSIVGGPGNDWLSGDRGHDTLTGGAGADIFHTAPGMGVSDVTDFSLAQGDRVQLDVGSHPTISQSGPNVLVDLGGGTQMILQNTQLGALNATPGWLFYA